MIQNRIKTSLINTLKYFGRGIVLPVDAIKNTIRQTLTKNHVSQITDFGAGTLFWSKWFAEELELTVFAVDTAYENNPPKNDSQRISFQTNIVESLQEKIREDKRAIFICDVIHHLSPSFWRSVFPQITKSFDVIFIKDIDANYKFGNFCNRLHDRIINGEKIHNVYPGKIDVYPGKIEDYLVKSGFTTQTKIIPKLWYPHFFLSGVKNFTED